MMIVMPLYYQPSCMTAVGNAVRLWIPVRVLICFSVFSLHHSPGLNCIFCNGGAILNKATYVLVKYGDIFGDSLEILIDHDARDVGDHYWDTNCWLRLAQRKNEIRQWHDPQPMQ